MSFQWFIFLLLFFTVEQSGAGTLKFDATLSRCAVCHGKDGNAPTNKIYPKLAGQNTVYLLKALKDFRPNVKHNRHNMIMQTMVASLSTIEMVEIANYYAGLVGSIDAAQSDLIPLGQRLYRGGDLMKGIPACLACHGPAGSGNPFAGFPRLSGQHAAYLVKQLKAFRSGKRVDNQHHMMSTITKKMTDADIDAVASYISGLYF